MTQKVTHPESISEMLHTLSILTEHIATSQMATVKSQKTGVYMNKKNIKKNESYVKIDSKCATLYVSYTHSQYFRFS